ncbi:MAG: UDP-2,4-diacetamido-2,4,6-trideoxy-beta-L-altropyranose hydrolase [Candidatus Omnitrophica bacterium]|nr:UDP-2,4-diacetamido-2,4,6-trideoxy-beta-L-altropyranose hydrolase [Candidatus Omnitrophota bacterium]
MKVLIITEGGRDIGFGHVTRCLSLYEAFGRRDIVPKFLVNSDNSVKDALRDIECDVYDWLEHRDTLMEDLKKTRIAIIDSYMADISLYRMVSELVKVSAYVDDMQRLKYPKGTVLSWSLSEENNDCVEKDGVNWLTGERYAPLRRDFYEIEKKIIKKNIQNILITFGGTDPKNMSSKILSLLKEKYPDISKKVVIGKAFKNIKEIEDIQDDRTELVYFPEAARMKELMLDADIAISAGGQTLFELARVGVPTITLCTVDNQLNNIETLKNTGFLEHVITLDNVEKLVDIIDNIGISFSYEKRKMQSKLGRKLVDGKGGDRIVEFLMKEEEA